MVEIHAVDVLVVIYVVDVTNVMSVVDVLDIVGVGDVVALHMTIGLQSWLIAKHR